MRIAKLSILFLSSLSVGLGGLGCSRSPAPEEVELASNGTPGGAGLANRTGTPVTGAGGEVADEDDDEDSKDYWKDITFGSKNFEEVRQQVKKRYIEPAYDEVWAYAQAAAFALGSSEEKGLLLLPESFYKARKDDAREKGELLGKVRKLSPSDSFVMLEESKAKVEEKRKRLSDDEIKALREWQMDRTRALHAAWDAVNFGEKEFERIMDFVEREFVGSKNWTVKNAWVAAAQGYLFALDPHSSLVAKSAWDDSTKKTQDSSFEGIGAVLTQRADSEYTIVESPIDGQPAVKAGIRAGDTIIEVDGKDIKGESLSKVVSRIRGPSGTQVVLTIQREGEADAKKISITRSHIAMKNVQGYLMDKHPDVGVVKVTGFVKTTDDDLVAEIERLQKLTKSGRLRGLILDLRNNSGGLLNQGIKMGDRFLKSGTIVTVKNRNSSEDEVYTAAPGDEWDFPMVVLVNDGTASAAEIVSSALQDNSRALVLGDRTFGKASVQTLYSPLLQDDYYIKLTVARYYAPSGRTLQVKGVVPDIQVTPEIDGKTPLGFREENLSGHLVPLHGDYVTANAAAAERAKACAEKSGIARKIHLADPNPAIRFDWQVHYGADVLECSISERAAQQMPQ